MKRYDVVSPISHETSDGEWVKASVAKELYDALKSSVAKMESDFIRIDSEWGDCRDRLWIEKFNDWPKEIKDARNALAIADEKA